MRSIFFFALLYCILHQTSVQAQALPSTIKPRVGVTILSDGKPTDKQTGIKTATKEISFKAALDTKSDSFFNDFQSELLVKNAEVIFARNGRRLAQANMPNGFLVPDLGAGAEPADHIVFKFTLVAQRKNGELVPLPEEPIYTFPIQK